ncbi:hypothetical protein M433DRAFT_66301 [Acidomyces richmondensis BFW]|nr:MAG: hypothetical protein FE78DRAFT_147011 [Acidomyces sp. 'richmondensis']KYG45901.1 hypothetical protein M433DRAFT_66301 [Acidomyces richmondensis BFW]
MVHNVCHRLPVTALAYWTEDVILAGFGHFLRAYNIHTNVLVSSLQVFTDQAIHGISVGNGRGNVVLVWGGRHVRAVSIDASYVATPIGTTWKSTDWILDAAFSPSDEPYVEQLIGLVSAHNALTITSLATMVDVESTTNVLVPVLSGSDCILYSAHIKWLSPSRCLIASGTAFGDVIVWSALLPREPGRTHAQTQTHYTFSAHDGSVFGVCISEIFSHTAQLGFTRLLGTCSDDRTIRIWNISDLSTDCPLVTATQRQTGFGSKNEIRSPHAPQCLAKSMGHVSRIWHLRFLNYKAVHDAHNDGSQGTWLISFGEDASSITWVLKRITQINDNKELPFMLEQKYTLSAHAGKHIWSVAISESNSIATGGADNSIVVSHPVISHRGPIEISRDSLADDRANFKAYCFVDRNVLLSTTNSGKIVAIKLSTDGVASVRPVLKATDSLRGYSMAASVPGIALFGGVDGIIYMYVHEHQRICQITTVEQKIAGLFLSSLTRQSDQDALVALVTVVGGTSARLIHFQPDLSSTIDLIPTKLRQWQLVLPEKFIATSFSQGKLSNRWIIFLGSRNGSIALYDVDLDNASSKAHNYYAIYKCAHGQEAVTCLRWAFISENINYGFLLSTGRDGTYAVQKITQRDSNWCVETIHQLALPFGPFVEGMELCKNGLRLWGFKTKHFIVYDILTQREIMSVECGGAHRNFCFLPHLYGGIFVWTKASALYQYTQTSLPFTIMNSGGHGREIKAVALALTQLPVIATGAEDTDIKLSILDGNGGIQCVQTLKKHNTGIQHLKWSKNGRYLFSSGGFEEFFVWKVVMNLPVIRTGVKCESVHPRVGLSDLRIMGFDIEEPLGEGDEFRIVMAYSDSTLKCWQYRKDTWSIKGAGNYLTACLTKVLRLHRSSRLMTTATDGHIVQWCNESDGRDRTLAWTRRKKVHQNCILAATSVHFADGLDFVITGGDDNAIGITRIGNDDDTWMTLSLPRAHAAAVTGIAIVRHEHEGFLLASASIDQRIQLWRVMIQADRPGVQGVKITKLASYYTPVADVSSLALYRFGDGRSGLLIGGVGMDLMALNESITELSCCGDAFVAS